VDEGAFDTGLRALVDGLAVQFAALAGVEGRPPA
jgi:hypothetical protein